MAASLRTFVDPTDVLRDDVFVWPEKEQLRLRTPTKSVHHGVRERSVRDSEIQQSVNKCAGTPSRDELLI